MPPKNTPEFMTLVAVAVGLSARYPVGVGRQLELERGLDINVAVLAAGGLLVFLALSAAAFVAPWACAPET